MTSTGRRRWPDLGPDPGWVGGLALPLAHLPVRPQQAVEGGLEGQVDALVEEGEVDLGRRVIDEALRAQQAEDLPGLLGAQLVRRRRAGRAGRAPAGFFRR